MTSRRAVMAVALCTAAFCGGSSLFVWAIPAVAGSGKAAADPQATAPPGGTATYVFSVDPQTRNALVRAYAEPDGVSVELNCPAGPDGASCWLPDPGPADIPATVYVPPSMRPGTDIRVTEVESDRSGTTAQDAVIEVVASPPPATQSPSPAPTGSSKPQPTQTATPTTKPTGTAPTTKPTGTAPTTKPTPTAKPTHSDSPTPKPTHKPAPTAKPTHNPAPTSTPTHRPTHKPTHGATPKPRHSRPPRGGTTQHPRPVHTHHAGPVGGSNGGPPGNGHVAGPGLNGHKPASSFPLPTVAAPGQVGLPSADQPQAGGQIVLPPADRPAPAPILPTGQAAQRPQPSPLPLPRVTDSPGTQPSASPSQGVVLPNRAAASTSGPSTFDLVEAQLIGLFLIAGGAMAALLRPVRARVARAKGTRPPGGPDAPADGPGSGPQP